MQRQEMYAKMWVGNFACKILPLAQTFEVYGCSDCSGCEHKAKCLYKYDAEKDAEKNKVMKINE